MEKLILIIYIILILTIPSHILNIIESIKDKDILSLVLNTSYIVLVITYLLKTVSINITIN